MAANLSSLREERTISEIRRLSHAGLAAPELLRRAAHALHRLAPFDLYAAATIDPASNLITHGFAEPMGRDEGRVRPVNPAWFDQHYFAEGYTETLDLMRSGQLATTIAEETGGQLERSLCYRESMRPAGIEHKAHAVFVDRGLWGDLELYRQVGSPPFSPREIDLLRRIAPDIGAGLKGAALRAAASTEEAGDNAPGVLIVDQRGQVTSTAAAERLLAELGDPRPPRGERDLPTAVHVVLGALRQTLSPRLGSSETVVPRLHVRGRCGRWLALQASAAEAVPGRAAERFVIIAPAQPREIVWLGLSAYDLSPREEEVVRLVVGGLSTKQISDRLFIAEHTVQRHLSNIFEKVGVRGRKALVKQFFVEQLLPSVN